MSVTVQRIVVAIALVLVLAGVNFTVVGHEKTLSQGQRMYLELAPVDPRSIMQGDYMALRFAAGNAIPKGAPPHGRIVVKLDERQVATFVRVHQGEALGAGERLLEYRLRRNGARIVTDAWYFQEGQGAVFQGARFGEVRVREDGVALLAGLRDAQLAPLFPSP